MESPLRPPPDPGFRLIETFGYAPGKGCAHLALHLARMARSAREFGISFDKRVAQELVRNIRSDTDLRCRLTLDGDGRTQMTTAPMSPGIGTWRLGIAEDRLNSRDPWLQHKTTQRQLYDTARANLPEGVDEVIFLNERDEVCEGTITNIFACLGNGLLTPPLRCGLLPGVLREELIAKGDAREATLTMDDLRRAHRLYVGNSLRGLIPARLVAAGSA